MPYYLVTNSDTRVHLGFAVAEDANTALEKIARDFGYQSWEAYLRFQGLQGCRLELTVYGCPSMTASIAASRNGRGCGSYGATDA